MEEMNIPPSIFSHFLLRMVSARKKCPYTTQQNGLAERKLRYVSETGLTLLAHSHLSNQYWADAFLIVVHIINRFLLPYLSLTLSTSSCKTKSLTINQFVYLVVNAIHSFGHTTHINSSIDPNLGYFLVTTMQATNAWIQ